MEETEGSREGLIEQTKDIIASADLESGSPPAMKETVSSPFQRD